MRNVDIKKIVESADQFRGVASQFNRGSVEYLMCKYIIPYRNYENGIDEAENANIETYLINKNLCLVKSERKVGESWLDKTLGRAGEIIDTYWVFGEDIFHDQGVAVAYIGEMEGKVSIENVLDQLGIDAWESLHSEPLEYGQRRRIQGHIAIDYSSVEYFLANLEEKKKQAEEEYPPTTRSTIEEKEFGPISIRLANHQITLSDCAIINLPRDEVPPVWLQDGTSRMGVYYVPENTALHLTSDRYKDRTIELSPGMYRFPYIGPPKSEIGKLYSHERDWGSNLVDLISKTE